MTGRIRITTRQPGSYDASSPTRLYEAGEEHDVGSRLMPDDLAKVFLREGWAQVVTDPKAGVTEQKVTTPPENKAAAHDLDAMHQGGGWYLLPNGEKVQGRNNALKALTAS